MFARIECINDTSKRALVGEEVLTEPFERRREPSAAARTQLRTTTSVRSSRGTISPV